MDALRRYFAIDARSLALFRICIGFCVFAEVSERLKELEAHYTDFGVLPRSALIRLGAHPVYSLYMLDGSSEFVLSLLVLTLIATLCLILGLFTRVAAVVTWVLVASLVLRGPLMNHASDSIMMLMLTWGAFLPLGTAWSVDARRRSRTAQPSQRAQAATGPAAIGLVLQPFAMYLVVTVSKLEYDSWLEGRAVFALLHKEHYVRPMGRALQAFPAIAELATYSTIFLEGLLVLLFVTPFKRDLARTAGVLLGTAFHLVLFSLVDVGMFQPLAITCALPLLPAWFWNRFEATRLDPGEPEWIAPDPKPVRLAALAILLLSYVSLPPSLPRERMRYPDFLKAVYRNLFLEQRFRMFANMDATRQGFWIGIGELADGRLVDVLHMDPIVDMEPPEDYAEAIPNDAWRIYWSNISSPTYKPLRPYLADYLCRRWNRVASEELQVKTARVIWMREIIIDPTSKPLRRPEVLAVRNCEPGRGKNHAR